jgi:hypothetical protein
MKFLLVSLIVVFFILGCRNNEKLHTQIYDTVKVYDSIHVIDTTKIYDTVTVTKVIGVEIHADRNNDIYMTIENPITIKTTENSKNLLVTTNDSGTKIKKADWDDTYIVTANRQGITTIEVARLVKGKKEILTKKEFRVKVWPDPVVRLGSFKGNTVDIETLKSLSGISVTHENFIDVSYRDVIFTVATLNEKGEYIENKSQTHLFTSEQKEQLKVLKSGDKFFIENIKVNVGGQMRLLNPLMFRIK